MLELIQSVNSAVNNFIWGVPAMICIIGVGLLLTIKTKFLQIRKFPYAMKETLGRVFKKQDASDGSMTPFQAVCTHFHSRNWKYCRSCRCDRNWWSWCCFLDVDFCYSWNVYEIFRSNTCSSLQRT